MVIRQPSLDPLPSPSCGLATAEMAGTDTCSWSPPALGSDGTEDMQFPGTELQGMARAPGAAGAGAGAASPPAAGQDRKSVV